MSAKFSRSFSFVLTAIFCLIFGVAKSQSVESYAGTWVMRLDDKNLFVLTLTANNGSYQGYFDLPAKIAINNSVFSAIKNGYRRDRIVKSHVDASGLHLEIQNANDPSDVNNVVMTIQDKTATLAFEALPPGFDIGPWPFVRAQEGTKVSLTWEPNRSYVLGDSDVSNPQMAALYAKDQQDRNGQSVDWKAIGQRDASRREQTRQLLSQGQLRSGKDFEEAAFIYQHGNSSSDYLLGHTLAVIAVSKGDSSAVWISAATMDRYLQSIKQPQIYGTQFNPGANGAMTQAPYDMDLISDALRHQLGVPTKALQADQLKSY